MSKSLFDNLILNQSTVAIQHTQTSYFRVTDFGFIRLSVDEKFPDTFYPTPNDKVPGGYFYLDLHNSNRGDFNGDGLQDLVILPMLFQHTIPHLEYAISPIILLQNQSGGFNDPQIVENNSNFPNQHFLYRIGVADFNSDGKSDFVASGMTTFGSDVKTNYTTDNLPAIFWGSNTTNFQTSKNFGGLEVMDPSKGLFGYKTGHSIATGDFNGDGKKDFASDHYQFLADASQVDTFKNSFLKLNNTLDPWVYPHINAMASADFNNDGYDDVVFSTMPMVDSGQMNGGDLNIFLGSKDGLKDESSIIPIPRQNRTRENIGTNFISLLDVNGDGNKDIMLIEHDWTKDNGDSSQYYSNGRLRLFMSDGKGAFQERSELINDQFSGNRMGEGNIHTIDVNGDGWDDVVLSGYQSGKTSWANFNAGAETSIFLNNHGSLSLVDEKTIPYVAPYQIQGYEQYQQGWDKPLPKMFPVDIGNDGMIDFVGTVETPMLSWPQTEALHKIGFIVRATTPLGRIGQNETLEGTANADRIFGYDGNDSIRGGKGNDQIDGGTGLDRSIYDKENSAYSISMANGKVMIADKTLVGEGTDSLINVERIKFSDNVLALDISGNAGQAYRLYQAALDRTPDQRGLADWINYIDNGGQLNAVSQMFIDSYEFRTKYGALDNYNFINQLYLNVLDRPGEAKGVSDWVGALNNGSWTRAQVLVGFSESPENQANVIGQIKNGIPYVEYWLS